MSGMCDSDEDRNSNGTSGNSPSRDTPGRQVLWSWLNKYMKVEMADGRILLGYFLCTDRDANVILGSCNEYLKPDDDGKMIEEPRMLGLAMIPGRHIVSVNIEDSNNEMEDRVAICRMLDDSEVLTEDIDQQQCQNCTENGHDSFLA